MENASNNRDTELLRDEVAEGDELYQRGGEKGTTH